jgi:hypothetical protein
MIPAQQRSPLPGKSDIKGGTAPGVMGARTRRRVDGAGTAAAYGEPLHFGGWVDAIVVGGSLDADQTVAPSSIFSFSRQRGRPLSRVASPALLLHHTVMPQAPRASTPTEVLAGLIERALGEQTRLGSERVPILPAQSLERRARLGVVEPDQHLTRLNNIAVMHQDLTDNAAFQVLDPLAERLRLDLAGSDRSTFERRTAPRRSNSPRRCSNRRIPPRPGSLPRSTRSSRLGAHCCRPRLRSTGSALPSVAVVALRQPHDRLV